MLVDRVLIRMFFGQIFKMRTTPAVGQDAEEVIVGVEDLLSGFIQVRVTQKDTGHDIERSFAKNGLHVLDHFLVPIRIGEYGLSFVLLIIQVAAVTCE